MSGSTRQCEAFRQRLPELAEGALSGRALARLDRHLSACPRCQGELAHLRAVLGALRDIGPEPTPEGLAERAAAAAYRAAIGQPQPARLWTRLAIPIAAATGLAAVVFAYRITTPTARPVPAIQQGRAPRLYERQAVPAPRPAGPVEGIRGARAVEVLTRSPKGMPGGQRQVAAPGTGGRHTLARRSGADHAAPAPEGEARDLPASATGLGAVKSGPAGPAGPPSEGSSASGAVADQALARSHSGRGAGWPSAPAQHGPASMAFAQQPRTEAEGAVRVTQEKAGLPAGPPVSARITLVKVSGRPALGLVLGAEAAAGLVTVRVGSGEDSRVVWQGSRPDGASVAIPTDAVGPGPGSVLISLETRRGTRAYRLFLPTVARLGDVAPSAPRLRYEGQSLDRVLADLAALTGLVLLAEAPLDTKVVGELPGGPPDAALAELAERAGFEVTAGDGVLRTLTHRR